MFPGTEIHDLSNSMKVILKTFPELVKRQKWIRSDLPKIRTMGNVTCPKSVKATSNFADFYVDAKT